MSQRSDALERRERSLAAGQELGAVLGGAIEKIASRAERSFKSKARENRRTFAVGDLPTPAMDGGDLFDAAAWDEAVEEGSEILGYHIVEEMGIAGLATRIEQPLAQEVLQRHLKAIDAYGMEARAHVSSTLDTAMREGWSVDKAAKAMRGGPMSGRAAELVARTEMVAAGNGGSFTATKAIANPGDMKEWISTPDDRTRPEHSNASGQRVLMDKPFLVGGEEAQYPGDSMLSTAMRAMCRCSWVLVPAEDIKTPADAQNQARVGMGDIPIPMDDLIEPVENSAMKHMTADGKFTAERQKAHDAIVAQHLKGVPVSKNPTFVMTGGGSGAGKSTVLNSGKVKVGKKGTFAEVNADDIKSMLPGSKEMLATGDPKWAAYHHEESSYLAKRVMAASRESKRDYLLDGTGDGGPSSVLKKLNEARDAGYAIEGVYVTIPIEEALKRAAARGVRSGRVVPETVTAGTHMGVSKVFPDITEHFDRLDLVENLEDQITIASVRAGKLEILDEERYTSFLDKANWSPDG